MIINMQGKVEDYSFTRSTSFEVLVRNLGITTKFRSINTMTLWVNGEKPNGEKPNGEKPNGEKPNWRKPQYEKFTIIIYSRYNFANIYEDGNC